MRDGAMQRELSYGDEPIADPADWVTPPRRGPSPLWTALCPWRHWWELRYEVLLFASRRALIPFRGL